MIQKLDDTLTNGVSTPYNKGYYSIRERITCIPAVFNTNENIGGILGGVVLVIMLRWN